MNQKIALKQLRKLKKLNKKPRLAAEGWDKKWKTLLATLLSARTRDEKTIYVCEKLFKKYPSVKEIANAKNSEIIKIIKPINFYKTKTNNLINCCKNLDKNYNGEPPINFEELIKLPGVGRKTANVFLAENKKQAIGVDTHVARISKKVGWTKNICPKKIEEDLKSLFPKKRWRDINYILVGFGRSYTRKQEDEILESY
jgi:endonuclease III